MVKFDYDSEQDILNINKSQIKESIELIDGFYIDLDSKKKIVGVEILFASKILSEISSGKINKQFLEDLNSVNIDVLKYKNSFILKLLFVSDKSKQAISMPVYDLFANPNCVVA